MQANLQRQSTTSSSAPRQEALLFAPRSRSFDVYASPATLYVVAHVEPGHFRVLFFDRREGENLTDILYADPNLYDRAGLDHVLREPARSASERRQRAAEGSEHEDTALKSARQKAVLQFSAHALLGLFRLLKGYYLMFLTERKRVGYINGHAVYSIEKTRLVPVFPEVAMGVGLPISGEEDKAGAGRGRGWSWLGSSRDSLDELEGRYLSLFQLIDLTRGDFFFSYTLDLTNTLQSTFLRKPVDDTYCWNEFLTLELREAILFDEQRLAARKKHRGANNTNMLPEPERAKTLLWTSDSWLVPLIHGSFQQQRCTVFGKAITLTLLGRRSRFNAGTRYLKRGINEQGKVANHVEVEQILEVDGASLSSFVQVRGSIPTFWTQDTSAALPKPPIRQFRVDPTFSATRQHFSDLMHRYGAPISVLNLVKQVETRPRESMIGREYTEAVDVLNCSLGPQERIVYDALDFKKLSKAGIVGRMLDDVAKRYLEREGVFFTNGDMWTFQNGAVRTNCIDGLDRTNVGQFCIGLCALQLQLERSRVSLPGGNDDSGPNAPITGPFLDLFVDMFEALGDRIAQQYGGSQAHKKGGVAPTAELLTSIRRYYSNSFTDRAKQDAINLFLGWFVPRKVHGVNLRSRPSNTNDDENPEEVKALWELESDFYLHNFRETDQRIYTMDTGTEQWWHGDQTEKQMREEMVAMWKRMPLTQVIRPPDFDADALDGTISFDRLADTFFKPLAIDGPEPSVPRKNPLRRLFKDKRMDIDKNASDDDDDRSSTAGTTFSMSRLGGGILNSTLPAWDVHAQSLFEANITRTGPTAQDAIAASSFQELPAVPQIPGVRDADFGIFMQAERIGKDAALAFAPGSIDPALLDYMADFTVGIDDVEGTRRVVVESNCVTEDVRVGPLSGLTRGHAFSELYTRSLSTAPVLRLPTTQQEDLESEEEKQRKIFEEYIRGADLWRST